MVLLTVSVDVSLFIGLLNTCNNCYYYYCSGKSPDRIPVSYLWCRERDQLPRGRQVSHQSISEESIVRRRESKQARNPPRLWNPGQTSPEVQNRGISETQDRHHQKSKTGISVAHEKNLCSRTNFLKKVFLLVLLNIRLKFIHFGWQHGSPRLISRNSSFQTQISPSVLLTVT